MDTIAGLPFWELGFDAGGSPDPANTAALAAIRAAGLTDLVVFSHGWNNSRPTAHRLYERMFTLVARQLAAAPAPAPRPKVGVAGVFWPSQRWSDEPEPDFDEGAPAGAPGAAAFDAAAAEEPAVHSPELDAETLAGLLELFPEAAEPLNRMAELLAGEASEAALTEFHEHLALFVAAARPDGREADLPGAEPDEPEMVATDDPVATDEAFADALQEAGAVLGAEGDGSAGFDLGGSLRRALHGAKEVLRQTTYWQMKERAGVVGSRGLGPLLVALHRDAPALRVHLVGHSFGARLVSYALTGLPGQGVSPVKSVVLLQGAFSQWALAPRLPEDPQRRGALAGVLTRIDGPFVAVHSRHDHAVGRFYPLASMAARDDAAGLGDRDSRWGGIGANGAQGADATEDAVRAAGPGNRYRFARQRVLNVDASDVVRRGKAPTGAHSDILHPELAWLILTAGGVLDPAQPHRPGDAPG